MCVFSPSHVNRIYQEFYLINVYIYKYIYVCMCVCVCVFLPLHVNRIYLNFYMINVYICICVYVWVCVYVCVRVFSPPHANRIYHNFHAFVKKNTRTNVITTHEYCEQYWTSPGGNTLQNSSYTATYHPSRKLSKLDEPDIRYTAGEVRTSSWATYFCEPLHMSEQRQDDQLEPIYNSSVLIQDVAWKSSRERWTTETGDERWSGRSVLAMQHKIRNFAFYFYFVLKIILLKYKCFYFFFHHKHFS